MTASNRRWLFITAFAAAVTTFIASASMQPSVNCGFACLNARPSTYRQWNAAQRARSRVAEELVAIKDVSVAVRLLPPPTGKPGEPQVAFAPDVAESARRGTLAALDSERAARGAWHGHGQVALVVANYEPTTPGAKRPGAPASTPAAERARNSMGLGPLWATMRMIPPGPATGNRCVVVVRLQNSGLTKGAQFRAEHSIMDGCAFYDAFGAPGREIGAMLSRSLYLRARAFSPHLAGNQLDAALVGMAWATRDNVEPCLGGDDDACDAVVIRALGDTVAGPLANSFPTIRATMSVESNWLDHLALSGVATFAGIDAFARIWKSDLPLVEAFHRETGKRLAEVVGKSAARMVSGGPRHTGFGTRATESPALTAGSSVLVLAFLVAALWGAGIAARRPRVGR